MKTWTSWHRLHQFLGMVVVLTGIGCDSAWLDVLPPLGTTPPQTGAGGTPGTSTPETPAGDCAGEAIPESGRYYLTRVRNLASPLPDPTGITSEGNRFWIVSGGHNSRTHTLVRFDPQTGATDRSFTFQNLIEEAGTGVYGIAWDGHAVWISVSGNRNKLVRVDPSSGNVMRTMSSPTVLGPSDLDFDGTTLWLSSGTGDLFQLDPVTGGIVKRFPVGAESHGRDHGIAFRPGQLWVGHLFGGMEIHDPRTGFVLAKVTHEDGTPLDPDEIGSSTFVGCQLVIASRFGITYHAVHPAP